MTLAEAIGAIYAQVRAPVWGARNLDGLADVLRDLSWLPAGPVTIAVPRGLGVADARRLGEVLAITARETATSSRPVRVAGPAR